MTEFSFVKYIEQAIQVEHGSAEAELPINVEDESTESDPALDTEVLVIAHTLKSAGVPTNTAIARSVPILGTVYESGWDLSELAPTRSRKYQGWLALSSEGDVYFCDALPDTFRMSHSDLAMGDAVVARGRYHPRNGTIINNEIIRYGMARLVARNIFEIGELDEELLKA